MNQIGISSDATEMSGQSSLSPLQKGIVPRNSWWQAQRARLRRDLVFIAKQAHLLSLLIKRPEVPWPAKIAGGCAIAYLFSPIQLIPTFIPVIGQLDDLLVLFLGTRIVRKFSPPAVLKECEERAEVASSVQVGRWEDMIRNTGSPVPWQRDQVAKHSDWDIH
jgi:uncharacterized membrane protein YkvA (DUF1232 family)